MFMSLEHRLNPGKEQAAVVSAIYQSRLTAGKPSHIKGFTDLSLSNW